MRRQWREASERAMPDRPRPDLSAMVPDAEEMLAAQRKFAEELLAALRPST